MTATVWDALTDRRDGVIYAYEGSEWEGPRIYSGMLSEGAERFHWRAPLYRFKVRPWIPHDGSGCPVDLNTVVRVRLRDGLVCPEAFPAEFWHWFLSQWTFVRGSKNTTDIVAYQIVEDEDKS